MTAKIHLLYPFLIMAAVAVSILLALLIDALLRRAGDPNSISAERSSTLHPIAAAAGIARGVGKMPDTNQPGLPNQQVLNAHRPSVSTVVNGVNSGAD